MFRVFVTMIVVAAMVGPVLADEASHKKAAEEMLDALNMEKTLASAIDTSLNAQIKANPGLAKFKPVFKEFFDKHMSYKALKNDLVKMYTKEFTEDELKQLTKFYKSPLGKKLSEKTPTLMQKGSELGMKRVQENNAELRKMIEDFIKNMQ